MNLNSNSNKILPTINSVNVAFLLLLKMFQWKKRTTHFSVVMRRRRTRNLFELFLQLFIEQFFMNRMLFRKFLRVEISKRRKQNKTILRTVEKLLTKTRVWTARLNNFIYYTINSIQLFYHRNFFTFFCFFWFILRMWNWSLNLFLSCFYRITHTHKHTHAQSVGRLVLWTLQ